MTTRAREGIVVLGAPRSGTTLVRRLLDAHPDIACPGETHVFCACARFLESERVVDGKQVGVLNGLAFAGFDEAEVLQRVRELAFGFLTEHARSAGKRRWAEKTAVGAFHGDAIERLCGDEVDYVCVVRHGLDVACSMREWVERSEAHPRELMPYVARWPRPLEAYCHAWVDIAASLRRLEVARPDNVHTVRYEDLVADPERELRALLERLGERWDAELLARAFASEPSGFSDWKTYAKRAADRSSSGRWHGLSPATIGELGAIANDALVDWGYEPVEIPAPRDSADVRRRYELGLRLRMSGPGDTGARSSGE